MIIQCPKSRHHFVSGPNLDEILYMYVVALCYTNWPHPLTCVMSVLASPRSPTMILTGSARQSRHNFSTFLRKVALKRRAEGEGRRDTTLKLTQLFHSQTKVRDEVGKNVSLG